MSEAEEKLGEGQGPLPRLPPGRHGLPREFVAENQRQRLSAGLIAAVAAGGYNETTITDIAAASGLSRRTFYVYFKTKEACFTDTYEVVASFLEETVAEAGEGERSWAARVRARLAALLGAFAANPDLVSFQLVAPPAAGGKVSTRHHAFLDGLLDALLLGRPKSARRPSLPARQGLAGGLTALIVEKAEAGEGERLPELLPDLAEMVLTPYLGRERAVAEAART
ncbi:MAG TPA: TetR/AcrR family transcriptional regulator [Solirubrobacterales bacterium]|nr:TetR/AcrR family transcriptional regulator [Solirubrobacterales bacterium]